MKVYKYLYSVHVKCWEVGTMRKLHKSDQECDNILGGRDESLQIFT